jgi:hypothetical protein
MTMLYRNIRAFCLLAIITLLLAITGYQFIMSSMQNRLQKELGSWKGRELSSVHYAGWQKKQPMVDLLSSMSFFNGQALHSASRFYRLGAALSVNSDKSGVQELNHQKTALVLIRESLLKQPVWSMAWLDLAYIKLSIGLLDNEFQQAYAKAFVNGRVEEFIIFGLTDIGFATWTDLTVDNRNRFLKVLELAVVRYPKYVIESAEYYHRGYIICTLIPKQKKLIKYCKK